LAFLDTHTVQIQYPITVRLLGTDVNGQVDETVAVTPFVVVPRDDLVEIVVQGNASRTIDDTAASIVDKVLRDNRQIGVSKDALETSLRSLLQGGLEGFASDRLFRSDGQVNQRNVRGRDTYGHSGQLSIEGRNDLSYSLGGSGRSRNQVAQCGTSRTPVLATLGGSINDELIRGGCNTKKKAESW
jgi:hypothetical protein